MSECRRRQFLIAGGLCMSTVLAGCGDYVGNPPPKDGFVLKVEEVSQRADDAGGFDLTVQMQLAPSKSDTIEGVVVLAYAQDGTEVARHSVGTLNKHSVETVTTYCSGFPTMVTVKTARSPCDDLVIDIRYLEGPVTPADERTWARTTRECEEGLPPERLLEGDQTPSATGN